MFGSKLDLSPSKETKADFSAAPSSVVAEKLHRSYQLGSESIKVLRGVSLGIKQGEKVFLCGASGAGKTTLLYTLAGLEKPESGEVYLSGESLYSLSSDKRAMLRNSQMGFIYQSYHLLPELTALENVMLPAMLPSKKKVTEDNGHRLNGGTRSVELLKKMGLAKRSDHLPTQLSGGEQQRVAIARALINDPPILFADEPTGNLDSSTGQSIIDTLFSVVDEAAKTLIVVTHDSELAKAGDRCLHLADGQIEKES